MKKAKNKTKETEKEDKKQQKNDLLSECQKERDEYLDLSKRLKADFLNLKKEMESQAENVRQIAKENFVKEILPVLDSLELSLKHIPDDLKDNNWVKGMLGIKGQLFSILKSFGVEEIKALGEKFDPNLHEAVSQEESDKDADTVIDEVQKGYKMNGKVIRASKVKVSK